jgi:ABC-type transporter Mla subunit MlaD
MRHLLPPLDYLSTTLVNSLNTVTQQHNEQKKQITENITTIKYSIPELVSITQGKYKRNIQHNVMTLKRPTTGTSRMTGDIQSYILVFRGR